MRSEMDKFPSGWRWGNVIEYKKEGFVGKKRQSCKTLTIWQKLKLTSEKILIDKVRSIKSVYTITFFFNIYVLTYSLSLFCENFSTTLNR